MANQTPGFHRVAGVLSFALVNFCLLRSRPFGFLLIRPSAPGIPRTHPILIMNKILDKHWCRFNNRIEVASIKRNTKHERQCFIAFSKKHWEENWIGEIENTIIQSEVFLTKSCHGSRWTLSRVFDKSSKQWNVNEEIYYYGKRTVQRDFSELLHFLTESQYRHCNYTASSPMQLLARQISGTRFVLQIPNHLVQATALPL